MNVVLDLWTAAFALVGCAFFTAGTVGILRFPDLRSRLHAMTKADTVGLGFVLVALVPRVDGVAAALKLLLIWLMAGIAGAVGASLLGGVADTARTPGPGRTALADAPLDGDLG